MFEKYSPYFWLASLAMTHEVCYFSWSENLTANSKIWIYNNSKVTPISYAW